MYVGIDARYYLCRSMGFAFCFNGFQFHHLFLRSFIFLCFVHFLTELGFILLLQKQKVFIEYIGSIMAIIRLFLGYSSSNCDCIQYNKYLDLNRNDPETSSFCCLTFDRNRINLNVFPLLYGPVTITSYRI